MVVVVVGGGAAAGLPVTIFRPNRNSIIIRLSRCDCCCMSSFLFLVKASFLNLTSRSFLVKLLCNASTSK